MHHPYNRKITFSQCVHCISKLKFPAAAFVLNLALFPIETQFLIKLLRQNKEEIQRPNRLDQNDM